MFDKAVRMKLRFATKAGNLSVEDLWDLPLSSTTGKVNLDEIAVGLYNELSNKKTMSFVGTTTKETDNTQLKFDVVKFIIDVKLEEGKKAAAEKELAARKQKIMEIITHKEDERLSSLTLEELRKQLEAL